jgi:hypothetical protein
VAAVVKLKVHIHCAGVEVRQLGAAPTGAHQRLSPGCDPDDGREQVLPVLLVIRNAKGEVRWMEVREYLQRETDDGKKTVKQIVFAGERFDVTSVRRWRERALSQHSPKVPSLLSQ